MNKFIPDEYSKVRWEQLIDYLGEKLQLGLLEKLRRVNCYQFEGEVLTIEPNNTKDKEFFKQSIIKTQIEMYLQDSKTGSHFIVIDL